MKALIDKYFGKGIREYLELFGEVEESGRIYFLEEDHLSYLAFEVMTFLARWANKPELVKEVIKPPFDFDSSCRFELRKAFVEFTRERNYTITYEEWLDLLCEKFPMKVSGDESCLENAVIPVPWGTDDVSKLLCRLEECDVIDRDQWDNIYYLVSNSVEIPAEMHGSIISYLNPALKNQSLHQVDEEAFRRILTEIHPNYKAKGEQQKAIENLIRFLGEGSLFYANIDQEHAENPRKNCGYVSERGPDGWWTTCAALIAFGFNGRTLVYQHDYWNGVASPGLDMY